MNRNTSTYLYTKNKGAGGSGDLCTRGAGVARDLDMQSRTAGEHGAHMSNLHSRSDAYRHAYAVSTPNAQLLLISSAVYASTDLADILASIGIPLPHNAMPDPAAFNVDIVAVTQRVTSRPFSIKHHFLQ